MVIYAKDTLDNQSLNSNEINFPAIEITHLAINYPHTKNLRRVSLWHGMTEHLLLVKYIFR